jgi:hypothetical protein
VVLPEVGSCVHYYPDAETRRMLGYPLPLVAIVKRVCEATCSVDIEVGGRAITSVPVDQRTPDGPTEFDPLTHWCDVCPEAAA